MRGGPRVLFFGTYDERTHPRVRVLREGLVAHGFDVAVGNVPLGIDTSARGRIARRPWLAPWLLVRIASAWVRLLVAARRHRRPDIVVVGYLGHFDVHLARRRFRRSFVVLDHMVGLGDTARDRATGSAGLLERIDRAALRAADLVLCDTDAQAAALPVSPRETLVVPVGAPSEWFRPPEPHDGPMRVVFFGLYTPLQGTPTIGRALALAYDRGATFQTTMIGSGQDLDAARAAAGGGPEVHWIPWIAAEELPAEVGAHDVCLGIFGAGEKAARVVPNKVFQGAAAGCVVLTSETAEQREALDPVGLHVPPGDPDALATRLVGLSADRSALFSARVATADHARRRFAPAAVTAPLAARLQPPEKKTHPEG